MGVHAVAAVALEELGGELGAVPVDVIEAIADHVHAGRLGSGAEGLARGQELTVAVIELPRVVDGVCAPDGTLLVRRQRWPEAQELAVLHELAHRMLERLDHTHVDVWRLALALGAPRSVLARLRAQGRCTALHVAAETGLPAWAAAWRLGALADR